MDKKTNNKILYIFDEYSFKHKISQYLKENKSDSLLLCPITTNYLHIKNLSSKIQIVFSEEKIKMIDFPSLFNNKAFEIKDSHIKFIFDYADIKRYNGKSIKEYFKFPFKYFSTWWFSLVSEKSVLKSNAFDNLVKLQVVLDLVKLYKVTGIALDIKNKDLTIAIIKNLKNKYVFDFKKTKTRSETFKLIGNAFRAVVYFVELIKKSCFLKRTMPDLSLRTKSLDESKYIFVTYFPFLDKERFTKGEFINKYYEPLQRALKDRKNDNYSWFAINSSIDGFSWEEGVKLGSRINSFGENLFFYEELLDPKDFLTAFLSYVWITIKFALKRNQFSRTFNIKVNDSEVNLWQIYRNEWYSSFCGQVLIQGIFSYLAFKKFFSKLKKDSVVCYYMENHGWEKALNIASKHSESIVIGIQHSGIPTLLLNYFEYPQALNSRDYVSYLPRPNYVGCVGKLMRDLFERQGWQKKELFILGGLRYKYLTDYVNNPFAWDKREDSIVVALTINVPESEELLYYVYQAFKNTKDNYRILIKGHYACLPVKLMIESLNITLDSRFTITDSAINRLLPRAKALITCGSTVDIEALACQCPVIVPHLVSAVDNSPLSNFTHFILHVKSPGELAETVARIARLKESPLPFEECKKFVIDYFDIADSDEDYLKRLEKFKETAVCEK